MSLKAASLYMLIKHEQHYKKILFLFKLFFFFSPQKYAFPTMRHRPFIFFYKEVPKNFSVDVVLAYQRILN